VSGRYNVLFLCTGNSARSIMAEAILKRKGLPNFIAYSAGSHPSGVVRPEALKQIESARLSTEGLRSKSWEEFAQPTRPAWTSSLPFAITRRKKSVRCGPASQ
jgi:arsenate reductase (thioredoxin)